jgi:hypothetical protein
MSACRYWLHDSDGSGRMIELRGREAWALGHLLDAGAAGCTPIDTPGPRWSDYVFKLRRRGINIETQPESHGGPFAGTHARYVLRSRVEQLGPRQVAA